MLLNTLKCTGGPPSTNKYLAQNVNNTEAEKLCFTTRLANHSLFSLTLTTDLSLNRLELQVPNYIHQNQLGYFLKMYMFEPHSCPTNSGISS